ncbi:lytic transglycosylase domain-containing protein [Sediminibacterium soli]|uniref:lytic transglycosylase domain-containing protein n=1 Tax=Sediminibacterium soli TaxID=2698829 RepID=UPI001379D69F|nr:lytic transglycosylase domain-containing protein [Sediminibacterium soli]NCI45469.1 lytic transglycosylase domain-containing protein [Sediminibacterium soli]
MKWFGLNINNPVSIARLGLVAFAALAGSMATMSFVPSTSASVSDTTLVDDKSGFKSLFTTSRFDASKPYTAQLNPRAVSFVQEYIRKQGKELEKMQTWGKPYFDLYDNILAIYGIPREMKYLSVIESHLRSGLVSWAGAVGPWQLMPYEAKRFGLRTGGAVDERTDFYKSTHVAARLMKELYSEFGDWLLVVAAYNGGSGRVRQAIRKAGSREFWDLQYYLPEETRNHVKKFIGTHYIMEGSGGWTTMTASETELQKASIVNQVAQVDAADQENTVVVEVSGRYSSVVICNGLLMDVAQFNKWNPGFDKTLSEGKKYSMRLQKDKAAVFEARKGNLLMESVRILLEGSTASR